MKRNVRRALSALLSVVMLLSLLVVPAGAAGETTKPTVWIVGDSTACDYVDKDGNYKFKRAGFGTALKEYIDSTAYDVQNLAISGESSKSFLDKANYTTMKNGIKEGDVLIIAWGHNDENEDPAKYTNPNGTWETEGSFAKSLFDNYVKVAQDAKAYPVLCTPIVRRSTSNDYSGERAHIKADNPNYPGGDYPKAIRDLGTAKNVPVIDMTDLTKEKWSTDGADVNADYHAYTATARDNTHLNNYGAHVVAQMLATELKKLTAAQAGNLAAAVDPNKVAPDKATQLVENPSWVDPATVAYTAPTDAEIAASGWADYVAGEGESAVRFHGTAFGQLGSSTDAYVASNYKIETDENGNMHIQSNGKSKIQNADDGMVMYYYRVNPTDTYELSAEVKINTLVPHNQAAFGLVARDDMYINKGKSGLNTDYVAAGTFGTGGCTAFARLANKDGVQSLVKQGTLAVAPAAGDVHTLKIVRSADNYTCTMDGVTTTFDTNIGGKDAEYDYIGMFVSREVNATFRNIVLKVNGTELCNTTAVVPFSFMVKDDGWKFEDASGAESETAVQGGKLSAVTVVSEGTDENAVAFVAVYDLNGKMTGVKSIPVKNGVIPVGLAMNGGETAKVFLLNKNTLEPYEGTPYSKTSGMAPVDPDAPKGPIQVWDFAGFAEANGELYTNRILPGNWEGKVSAAGVPNNEEINLNGLLFKAGGGSERLYSDVEGVPSQGDGAAFNTTYEDGYTSHGGLYCNGTGDKTKRYLTVKDAKAGDKIVAYIGFHNGAGYFTAGKDGEAEYTTTATTAAKEFKKYEFLVKQDGDFKIWPSGSKPYYHRVMLVPPVDVSGAIDFPAGYTGGTDYTLKFVNQTTKDEVIATVDKTAKTYTAKLAPGYEYSATLSGVTGWGFTTASKRKTVEEADLLTGADWDLAVEAKSTYTYSGTITGFAQGYDTTKLAVTMTPTADFSTSDPVPLALDGMNFSATLEPTVEYTVTLAGVNDYQVKTPAKVTSESGNLTGQTIEVEPKTTYAVDGNFVDLDGNTVTAVTAMKLKNVEDEYEYPAEVNAAGGSYTVNLRPGSYEVVATATGYETKGHVVVTDKAVTKDILFVSTATPAAVTYAADIYVGDETKGALNYPTVTKAMEAIGLMSDRNDRRVTVHIAPGTYREQIDVNAKNVTFVNADPKGEVKLTWYYGIGYKYYSATGKSGTDSWYDPELAFDKYQKNTVARWGAAVRVTAEGFRAQDITFENSFNRYLTEEELADGVEAIPGTDKVPKKPDREYGLDVTSKTATERAAAIYLSADNAEFKNCKFLSSQDTLGTGGTAYFKDCYIEGMTDYICGPGNVVFDTCTLNWKGYSDQAVAGYITAAQTAEGGKGYLFRNCYVSADTKLKTAGGALGRTWGKQNTGCIFLNTTLQNADMLTNATWVLMNADAAFTSLDQVPNIKEFGTTLADGTAVDLTKRAHQPSVQGTAPTFVLADYFGTWVPSYYTAEADGVALATSPALTVTDNGDINLPKPGHTLTVEYALTPAENNANDVSTIQWYRVKDGTETPVKTAAANADKTYQIQTEDVGAQIKVTVTPKTMGGQTGTAGSYTVAEAVQEGYDDPSGAVDPVLGTGVNVYLAGDSTVKDYSVNGMWTKGINQTEGSWGEWLPMFFNDKVTIVDYAQGGRTTRSFIEQDNSLSKIDATMKKGDYLCIQFGHNDCHTQDNRYVPLGITSAQKTYDEGGSYPDTVTLTAEMTNNILPAGTYTTYTGYLKKYIEVTEKHGATAVLMTPVARMYYTSDGKIRPHHDAAAFDGTSDNEYCKAVKWVYDWAKAQGYNVIFIDNYQLTADLFEKAYADCTETDKQTYGKQLMGINEGTHNSKLGGLIWAGLVAQTIQNMDLTISKAVQAPTQIQGKTPEGKTAFTVNGAGELTAFDNLGGFVNPATYWETEGQTMFQAIADKAAELNTPVTPAE